MIWTQPPRSFAAPADSDAAPPGSDGRRGPTRRWLLALFGGLVVLPWLPSAAGAQTTADAAQAFIRDLGDEMLEIIRRDPPEDELRAAISGMLDEATDVDLIGRLALGPHWRAATEEQREEYLRLFRQLAVRNLAYRVDAEQVEGYEVTRAEMVDDRVAMVSTQITRPGAPPLRVDWRVRETDGELQIIDVVVEGASMVVSQRSEFASIVERQGFDGLLNQLRQQVEAAPA
jgi:phospholipid transport system substrate-binding protein